VLPAFSLCLLLLFSGCTIRSGRSGTGRISLTQVLPASRSVSVSDVKVRFVRPVSIESPHSESPPGIFYAAVEHASGSSLPLRNHVSPSKPSCAADESCTASEFSSAFPHVGRSYCAPVYVIIIDSPVDPLRIGRLNQLAGVIRRAGFSNVEFFHPWVKGRSHHLTHRVLEIRRRCPDARVVMIGWSMGTIWAGNAARSLAAQGVCIDSFINMDSKLYGPTSSGGYPPNIHRTLLLYRNNANVPSGVPGSYLVRVNEFMHLRVPSNTSAQNAIVRELRHVASNGMPTGMPVSNSFSQFSPHAVPSYVHPSAAVISVTNH
jgi:hypothetical protein